MLNPLQAARAELLELKETRAKIDARIAAVEQTIKILEPVYGGEPESFSAFSQIHALGLDDSSGLTDRIRQILLVSRPGVPTPTAIRDLLIQTGFKAEGRSNFLSEVHNILKRLVVQGEAEEVLREDGAKGYRMIPRGKVTLKYRK